MLFIGPSLLSGIGQVVKKYAELFNSEYLVLCKDKFISNRDVFIFALPTPDWLENIPFIIKYSKSVTCMTICETETVHEEYGKLFKLFDKVAVPSEFCKKVFSRQFPETEFKLIHCYVPYSKIIPSTPEVGKTQDKYIFYHIGNIIDPRKNIRKLIEAFYKCNFGDKALLVLKATCNQKVEINLPNVQLIQGLIPFDQLQQLHIQCHCYVSFSHSEGVGMGAVEAALQNKPVIITEYGGAQEYIKTPYTVKCGLTEIPNDDFLFKKGMQWGDPDQDQLIEYMKNAFEEKVYHMEHAFTRDLVSKENIKEQLTRFQQNF